VSRKIFFIGVDIVIITAVFLITTLVIFCVMEAVKKDAEIMHVLIIIFTIQKKVLPRIFNIAAVGCKFFLTKFKIYSI